MPVSCGRNWPTFRANALRYPDTGRVHSWRKELADVPGFRVGIAWQGNPEHLNDVNRSIPLSQFQPLAKVPGVTSSVCRSARGVNKLRTSAVPAIYRDGPASRIAEEVDTETAAAMANLDLVISCDTTVAHLAGALGVPVWVALPWPPIGVGFFSGKTTPGIRPCGSFARNKPGIGRKSSHESRRLSASRSTSRVLLAALSVLRPSPKDAV